MSDLDHRFGPRSDGGGHVLRPRREEGGGVEREPLRLMAGAPRGSALAAALGAAQASGPSVDQLRALEARVLAGTGVATIAAASVVAANQGTQAAVGLGHAWLAALPGKIAIGLVVAAAGAGGTVVALKRGADTGAHKGAAAVATRSAPSRAGSSLGERPVPRVAPAPAAASGSFALTRELSMPAPLTAAPTSAPAPVAPLASGRSRSRPAPSRPTGRAPSSSLEELRLLDLADAAVQSDPSLALRLTEQHARRYPNGLLGDERDVIEIAALVRLGRREPARAKASSFLRAHPGSAYAAKVRALANRDD
ncbi:MAG TPA: hypothetical protein VIU64_07315 [Polyangia bacterium]